MNHPITFKVYPDGDGVNVLATITVNNRLIAVQRRFPLPIDKSDIVYTIQNLFRNQLKTISPQQLESLKTLETEQHVVIITEKTPSSYKIHHIK